VDPENLPEADVLVVSEGASSAVRRRLGCHAFLKDSTA